jgi:hypothetical protein
MTTGAIAEVYGILHACRRSLDPRGYRGGPEMPNFLYVSLQDDNEILVSNEQGSSVTRYRLG